MGALHCDVCPCVTWMGGSVSENHAGVHAQSQQVEVICADQNLRLFLAALQRMFRWESSRRTRKHTRILWGPEFCGTRPWHLLLAGVCDCDDAIPYLCDDPTAPILWVRQWNLPLADVCKFENRSWRCSTKPLWSSHLYSKLYCFSLNLL